MLFIIEYFQNELKIFKYIIPLWSVKRRKNEEVFMIAFCMGTYQITVMDEGVIDGRILGKEMLIFAKWSCYIAVNHSVWMIMGPSIKDLLLTPKGSAKSESGGGREFTCIQMSEIDKNEEFLIYPFLSNGVRRWLFSSDCNHFLYI